MKRIFKYAFRIEDEVSIDMPIGAEILSVQEQKGTPCIWALVDDTAPKTPVRFRILGTGHPADDVSLANDEFVGTFQIHGGDLVFHLFVRCDPYVPTCGG